MSSLVQRTTHHPRVVSLKNRVRKFRNTHFDQQLRQLRKAVREMRRGDVDVLVLGDSTWLYTAPGDKDGRRLADMLRAELPGRRVVGIIGPGYRPQLHSEFVRLLGTLEERPQVVVNSLVIRTSAFVHISEHPTYGYRRSVETLRTFPDADARLWQLPRDIAPTPEEYASFDALPVKTRWGCASTIGEYRERLRGHASRLDDPETLRLLFDYFHGEYVTPDNPALPELTEYGRRLREYGVPVVSYRTSLPIDRGETLFPGEFADHMAANHAMIEAAYSDGTGPAGHLVASNFSDDEFIDPRDGTEHYNDVGRRRLAKQIADQVRTVASP